MTIGELSKETGVKIPTIHMYRQAGLLPEPTRLAANRFRYDRRHVEAIRLIRLLRERRRLPLDEIRRLLPTLDEEAFRPEMWDQVVSAQIGSGPEARIVDTARELFARRGYAGVGIEDICRQAGLAKGSFYRYFASKDDVFLAAVTSIPGAVGKAMGEGPPARAERDVVAQLVSLTAPVVPLLLEVAARAGHGEAGHAGVVGQVMEQLVDATADRLPPRRRTPAAARRVVGRAMAELVGAELGVALAAG
jgi:AcrR family transcriptional regulator